MGDATNTYTTPSPSPHYFHSNLSLGPFKFIKLLLAFRLATFSLSLASSISMISINHSNTSLRWHHFSAFRYVVAANAIVAIYSLFEMVASLWEISKHTTLLPQVLQVWFDFGHDQAFAYLLLSAESVGTEVARRLKGGDTCTGNNTFCVQSDISISLGFAGFLFLALSSLLSGYRVVCFIKAGNSRF